MFARSDTGGGYSTCQSYVDNVNEPTKVGLEDPELHFCLSGFSKLFLKQPISLCLPATCTDRDVAELGYLNITAISACAVSKGKECNFEEVLSKGYFAFIERVYLDPRVSNSTGAVDFLVNQFGIGAALHAASKAINGNITLTCGNGLPEGPVPFGYAVVVSIFAILVTLVLCATVYEFCFRTSALASGVKNDSHGDYARLDDGSNNDNNLDHELAVHGSANGASTNGTSGNGIHKGHQHGLNASRDENGDGTEHPMWLRFILCFGLVRNCDELFAPRPSKGSRATFASFDGIRVLAMFAVILGHTGLWEIQSASSGKGIANVFEALPPNGMLGQLSGQVITNAEFSVDSFFFLSGFLVMYILMSKVDKGLLQNHGMVGWIPAFVAQRYLRLAPTLAFVIFAFQFAMPSMGPGGPFWANATTAVGNGCGDKWHYNLLFVNNLVPADKPNQCYGVTWYLADDMQLFVFLVPIFCLVAAKIGELQSATAMLVTCVASITFSLFKASSEGCECLACCRRSVAPVCH